MASRVDKDATAPRPETAPVPTVPPPAAEATDLAPVVGGNLRRLRTRRGLSLERLAQISGVSRAMLGQIELGQSAPTINVLWKIARALEVTFSALISARTQSGALVLRSSESKILTSKDRSFSSRALFPFDEPRRVEFYELRLAAASVEEADAHPPGTSENLVVTAGTIEIDVAGDTHRLETGDSIHRPRFSSGGNAASRARTFDVLGSCVNAASRCTWARPLARRTSPAQAREAGPSPARVSRRRSPEAHR